jgi:hypothetical protein
MDRNLAKVESDERSSYTMTCIRLPVVSWHYGGLAYARLKLEMKRHPLRMGLDWVLEADTPLSSLRHLELVLPLILKLPYPLL